jgi:hypothetical protein
MLTQRKYCTGYEDRKPHHQAPANLGVVSEPRSTNLGGPSQRSYILAQGATLALQVERKVEEKVHAIRSELPIYVKVMTTSNVYRIGMMACEMVSLHFFIYNWKYENCFY